MSDSKKTSDARSSDSSDSARPPTKTPTGRTPGKFWVGWFDPRALAVLGVLLVMLCSIAAIIAFWANNNAQPVAITRPAVGATLEAGKLGVIEGTASPGALVKLYDNAAPIGEARADSAGRWSFEQPAGLKPGAHTLRADAVDAGNRLTTTSVAWTLSDPTAVASARPAGVKPTITAPASGAAFATGKPVDFAGTAAPGMSVRLIGADGSVLGTTTAGADGAWRLQIPATAAFSSVIARVVGTDGVNLDSAPVNLTITPAATAVPAAPALLPATFGVLPGVDPPANPLKEAPAGIKGPAYDVITELSGSAGATAKVRLFDGDKVIGETSADARGNWTFKLVTPFGIGPHSITAAAVIGSAEGPRSVAQAFSLVPSSAVAAAPTKAVAVAPSIALLPAIGGSILAGQPISFTGTAAPGASVQIVGPDGKTQGTVKAGPDGKWTLALPSVGGGSPVIARVVGPDGANLDSAPLTVAVAPAPTKAPEATKPAPVITPTAALAAATIAPAPTLAPTKAPEATKPAPVFTPTAALAAATIAPASTLAPTKALEATKPAPIVTPTAALAAATAAPAATVAPTKAPEATKAPEPTKVAAAVATPAQTATPTPRVLLGITGGPQDAGALPFVIETAGLLVLALAALARRARRRA